MLGAYWVQRHAAGGPEGDRTLDLCVANAALSQLSYKPIKTKNIFAKQKKKNFSNRKTPKPTNNKIKNKNFL